MNEDQERKEDISPFPFPENLLRDTRLPKKLSGPFTKEEERAIFHDHCKREGIRLADEMKNITDTEANILDKVTGILVGRQDRHAAEVLIANYSNRLAQNMVNDMRGRFRSEKVKKEDVQEVQRRRYHTYISLWREIAKRG